MQNHRCLDHQRLQISELHRLNRAIGGGFRATKARLKKPLNALWRLAQVGEGLEVRREEVEALAQYDLAWAIDHNLFRVGVIELEWARYFHEEDPVDPQFRRIRDYLSRCMLEDPLYVRDLERVVRGDWQPVYGLTTAVLEEEKLLQRIGDKVVVRADLREFFRVCFPQPVKEVKLHFR